MAFLIMMRIFTPTLRQSFTVIRKVDNTIADFAYLLSYETWEDVFSETEVNITYNKFLNTYLRIFYASFPMVKVKNFQSTKPWITKGIKISCLNKRKLYLNCNGTNVDLKNHYNRYCQVLSKVITTAKNLYYNNLISQADNKQKVTWNIINTLTNKKTSSNNDPPNINSNSSTSIANTLTLILHQWLIIY